MDNLSDTKVFISGGPADLQRRAAILRKRLMSNQGFEAIILNSGIEGYLRFVNIQYTVFDLNTTKVCLHLPY